MAHPVNGRARRAADLARRVSLVVELLVVVVLLGWLASWHGLRPAAAGVGLLALGWLLHEDGRPQRDSTL